MGKKFWLSVLVLILITALFIPISSIAGSDDQPDPDNWLYLDILFNTVNKTMDAGGYSHEELSELISPEVADAIAESALEYEDILGHLRFLGGKGAMRLDSLAGDQVLQLLSSTWTEEEQDTAFDLLNNMLIENTYYFIPPSNQRMVKKWMDSSIVQIDVRTTDQDKEVSTPLTLVMEAPIQVEIEDDNSIAIEGVSLKLETEVDKMVRDTAQTVVGLAEAAAVGNVVAGWKQGQVLLYADGEKLPTVTVHEAGLQMLLNEFAGSGVAEKVKPEIMYSSTLGVDVTVPGGKTYGITFAD